MRAFLKFDLILSAGALLLLLSACGDVGSAPKAETGEAVQVSGGSGETLTIDTSRSEIKWRAAKVTRTHDGGFRTFDGTLTVEEGKLTGVDVRIDARSIWSDTERLTGHLKSEDFFEVETYPTARFEADRFVPVDSAGATHLVTGNLTMHGQTNGVTFPATIEVTEDSVRARADFIIYRSNWGINYKGKADDLVEDNVRVILDVVAGADASVAAGDQGVTAGDLAAE